jgi:predicted GNAT superfamily acetyltransferase
MSRASSGAFPGGVPEGVVVRDLETQREFEAVVALQRATWGADFEECVPTAILRIAAGFGGVIAGAFAAGGGDASGGADAELVGFVFGLTGWLDSRPVHWSDMLAVRPAWRGRGVGVALKAWQRERLLGLGVEEMRWSFDPLEAANARLNLVRLGAVGRWYVEDMYGASSSPLHLGVGTDRLVVSWDLVRAGDPREGAAARAKGGTLPPGSLHLPIPAKLQELKRRDPEEARAWRLRLRATLAPRLAEGWEVRGVDDPGPTGTPALVVVPPPTASEVARTARSPFASPGDP